MPFIADMVNELKSRGINVDSAGSGSKNTSGNLIEGLIKDHPELASKGFKKGGKVSSASSRADGIAQRGKTNCKMC